MAKTRLKNIKLGSPVKIKYDLSGFKTVQLNCHVIDSEEDRIYLDFPEDEEDKKQYFFEGQEVQATLITLNGIREYKAMVIYAPLEGKFVIEYYDNDNEMIQRRQYLRAFCEFDLILYQGKKFFRTKTIDLSGGGAKIRTECELEDDAIYDYHLLFKDDKIPSIKGKLKILRTISKNEKENIYVILFQEISELERNYIIKMCFKMHQINIKESNN